ncbi:MAG: O-antigen ligase family protein [Saprospiraceae bacterium]|uniref:O-antigen ligase family protein n=1 Tax=Candidatus Defluviibacterium haderslevense TaxID=2981993 RepID=A0A9D7XGP2_9BACT|nr:O-antigen ligase family protein [Candidatus Defluviibacterium haderslevense]
MQLKFIIPFLFLFLFSAFAFALPWAMYVVSASMVLMTALCLFQYKPTGFPFGFNIGLKNTIRLLRKEPLFCWMIAYYFSFVISGLWSAEYIEWVHYSRLMLPFLFLPIIFIHQSPISNFKLNAVILIGILSVLITSGFILYDYFTNYEVYQLEILKGKPIKTYISHIRYSLIIAASCMILIHWLVVHWAFKFNWEKWVYAFCLLYLFIVIHILSVKSGLLGLYIGVFLYMSYYMLLRKKFSIWIICIISMVIIIASMIYFIPSLKHKYLYSIWQIGEWSRGKWLYYSDIERWLSIQMGWNNILDHPILGTGIGDLKTSTDKLYMLHLNHKEFKLAHNQFIFSWAYCGLPSLFSLMAMIYYSLFSNAQWRNPLILSLQGILLSSFLYEATLSSEIGICVYLYFTIIGWMIFKNK